MQLSDDGRDLLGRLWPAVEEANDLSHLGLTPNQTATLNDQLHTLLRGQVDDGPPTSRPGPGSP